MQLPIIIQCEHWDAGACRLGLFGGKPSAGVCRRCEHFRGEDVNPNYIAPPPPTKRAKPTSPQSTNGGPGTILHNKLSAFGIQESPSCSCMEWVRRMDAHGCEWSRIHADEIAEAMVAEAKKRKWIKLVPSLALKASALVMVHEAIKKAEAIR